jgi:hypothetical protein
MSTRKGSRRGRAKFFGFPLSKQGANIVFILGILILIGAGIQLLWLVYSFTTVGTALAAWGAYGYYAGSYMMYMIPCLVIVIVLLVLGIYMIKVGKKGR